MSTSVQSRPSSTMRRHGAGLGVRVAVRDEAAVGQLVGVFVHGVHLTNILRFVRAFVKKVYTR